MDTKQRIDYIDKYISLCDDIRKKYPCISLEAFAEKYYKEFDETEIGTYIELVEKRDKLRDNIKFKFDSYNHERERKLNNAKVWLKRIMFEYSVDRYSDDIVIQNKISEYLYKKASDESVSLAECWNSLEKYNTMISDIIDILKEK